MGQPFESVPGYKVSWGQTPYYYGVYLFFENNYLEFLADERGIENITSQVEKNDPYFFRDTYGFFQP